MTLLRVAGAQLNPVVGDLEGNRDRILHAMEQAADADADVLLLPELAVTGYPPEDLVLRRSFVEANLEVVRELAAASHSAVTVVGFIGRAPDGSAGAGDARPRPITNAAALLARGEVHGVYHKKLLPNYGVFDEDRYFVPGDPAVQIWEIAGIPAGISICEDIWVPDGPTAAQAAMGARILLNINGSPYHRGKPAERAALIADQARRSRVPVVYLNMVGGQDELVFDGDSMVVDAAGDMRYRAAQFEDEFFVVDVPCPAVGPSAAPVAGARPRRDAPPAPPPPSVPRLDPDAEIYTALTTGLRDYVVKNGFRSVVVGLSGGIDSALTAAIAVDALGPEAVWGVTMPGPYSSPGSVEDSRLLAANLGIRFDRLPIGGIFESLLGALEAPFAGTEPGVAEENLQARIRGALLMALSNKFGGMVVATGNKSEMAVGYATLYGDMAGGFAVLKDVFKTTVYRLAEWRNRDAEVIPAAIIHKPPSAELRPDQLDTDSLPEYEVLDAILERYVEGDEAPGAIAAAGFDPDLVRRIAAMVDHNEYKRRQAAPGVKITAKAFGRDRRLPITNRFRG